MIPARTSLHEVCRQGEGRPAEADEGSPRGRTAGLGQSGSGALAHPWAPAWGAGGPELADGEAHSGLDGACARLPDGVLRVAVRDQAGDVVGRTGSSKTGPTPGSIRTLSPASRSGTMMSEKKTAASTPCRRTG